MNDKTPTMPHAGTTRRMFIRQVCSTALIGAGGLAVAGCSSTAASVGDSAALSFIHGVASGDPLNDRVILWTRVTPHHASEPERIDVRWQMATDPAMQHIVAAGSASTAQEQDYTVKVDATGLLPGHSYYYQFAADGIKSPIGRAKTLPRAEVRQVRLAVFTCANYPAGYFNVYADAAKQDDIDAALHIGDYIYEYEATGYACSHAVKLGRVSEPRELLLGLSDYRRRYGQYRTDPDLQAVHAAMPFIVVWDDHEFADDAWREGSVDHRDNLFGPFSLRRAAAIRAYHEWMPIRAPDAQRPEMIYRSFDFGTVLSLHMLDTRLIGRDQQLKMSSYYNRDKEFDEDKFKQDVNSPHRHMMGDEQIAWLESQVQKSKARWQVLGQQVLMARMEYPSAVALGDCNCTQFSALKERASKDPASIDAEQKEWLADTTLPCYMDSWDGYQHDRELVFSIMQRHRKNMVALAGDTHNAWASDLHDADGRQVGVEFATSSVSSPGMEGMYPDRDPEDVAAMMVGLIEPLYYAQTSKRGYMIVTASHEQTRCDWRFVDTIYSHEYTAETGRSLRVLPGPGNRKLAEC